MIGKIKNVNFRDINQPLTMQETALLIFCRMSLIEGRNDHFEGSALSPEDQPYFGAIGNLYYDDKKKAISTSCMTIEKVKNAKDQTNTFSVPLENYILTNEKLEELVSICPENLTINVDKNCSPRENLANIAAFTIGTVQVKEDQFKQDKESVTFLQKFISRVKTGREPYERDTTITEKIQDKAGYLYSGSSFILNNNVRNFASVLGDFAYDVQSGKDPKDMVMDILLEKEVSAEKDDSPELGD